MTHDELWPKNILQNNTRIIKDNISHQGIGGKIFIIDEAITETLTPSVIFNKASSGNLACFNFIKRRYDFNINFPYKLYYGKVEGLGYIIAEDEFKN